MLSKSVLALLLALGLASGWLMQAGGRPPVLSIQSTHPGLTTPEARWRSRQSQPNHWRALLMRANSVTARVR